MIWFKAAIPLIKKMNQKQSSNKGIKGKKMVNKVRNLREEVKRQI